MNEFYNVEVEFIRKQVNEIAHNLAKTTMFIC